MPVCVPVVVVVVVLCLVSSVGATAGTTAAAVAPAPEPSPQRERPDTLEFQRSYDPRTHQYHFELVDLDTGRVLLHDADGYRSELEASQAIEHIRVAVQWDHAFRYLMDPDAERVLQLVMDDGTVLGETELVSQQDVYPLQQILKMYAPTAPRSDSHNLHPLWHPLNPITHPAPPVPSSSKPEPAVPSPNPPDAEWNFPHWEKLGDEPSEDRSPLPLPANHGERAIRKG